MSDELRRAAAGPLAQLFSSRFLEEHALLPLREDKGSGVVAVAAGREVHPTVVDELARILQARVALVPSELADIRAAIIGAREASAPLATVVSALGDLRAKAEEAPVVQLVNAMLSDALRMGASDVHIESTSSGLRVRLRLDGVLRDAASYPMAYQAGAISRLKLLAGLDIGERRLPQDGRARIRLNDRQLDVRVATLPALHGESLVVRLLDHESSTMTLADLGMPEAVQKPFEALLHRSVGLVLVTGPTGSGKTTTLHAALQQLNVPGVKIVAVEDPVEYQQPGITQIPVNRKAGLDFANVLRSILRHDPDVIMVGEMRDPETADMAVQAALTGHLVFSTLHTNDATSAVTRLVDMGVAPYLVAATLQGVLAQRLVRVLCSCARPAEGVESHAGLLGTKVRRAVGCPQCGESGYRGRTGIYELLTPTDSVRDAIVRGMSLADMRTLACASAGMVSLADAGMDLVRQGVTSLDEVLRVTGNQSR